MPVQVQWEDVERTILGVTHTEVATWEDFHKDDEAIIVPMLESVAHTVAIIVDLRQTQCEIDGQVLPTIQQCIDIYQDCDIDIVVFVSDQGGVRTLMETAHRRYGTPGREYYAAQTIDEAHHIIIERRAC